MKKIIPILIAAVLVVTMAACGTKMVPPTEPTATPTQAQTTAPADTNKPDETAPPAAGKIGTQHDALLSEDVLTAELKVGQTLAIYLKENPSTGYAIKLSDVPAGLTKKMDEYVAEPVASGIVGSGGIHIYSFTADKAGTYKLRAGIYPPGKTTPSTTYDFTITVK